MLFAGLVGIMEVIMTDKERGYIMRRGHRIAGVEENSIAEELGIEPGDTLLSVGGEQIEDVFDYHYLMNDTYVEMLVGKPDGEQWLLEIDKDEDEDVGLIFESGLMDRYRSCSNRCIFCFIDQMPPGMRDTLYFKDDDSRLSFLQGNYVTLTNMREHDIERIIRYHLSPINISVHTTNPELRCRMLRNRFAGESLGLLDRLRDAGIEMNGQIVLCRGINDGEELERTIGDLAAYLPCMRSVSVVPVGLTRWREGLEPLEPFGRGEAREVLTIVRRWQEKLFAEHGVYFIHASDEWYLLAREELPPDERYEGYPQLENGVGMLRLLRTEVGEYLRTLPGDEREVHCSIATGVLAAPLIRECAGLIREKYPRVEIDVVEIVNDFFGHSITVAGLITGTDLKRQLAGRDLGEKLLIPCHMLRSGESVFLDDVTVEELEEYLGVPVVAADERGCDLVDSVIDPPSKGKHRRRQIYEQTDRSNCGPAECGQIHTL